MGTYKKFTQNAECLRKTNVLVYETPIGKPNEERMKQQQHQQSTCKPSICTVQPKPIRICTGAEMKKICPQPKPLPKCMPKSRFGILGVVFKAALAAGAIYATTESGLWGSSDDSQQLYSEICRTFKTEPFNHRNDLRAKWEPPCHNETPIYKPHYCDKPMINRESDLVFVKEKWNHFIQFLFCSLTDLPNQWRNISTKLHDRFRPLPTNEEEFIEKCTAMSDEEVMNNQYKAN